LLLDKLADRIDANISGRRPVVGERRAVELAIRSGIRRGSFSFGNGEKIFKRLINFARQVRAELSDELFVELLCDWPSLRQSTLAWWQSGVKPEARLQYLSELFSGGALVDDAARMDATVALVAARLPNDDFVKGQIAKIVSNLDQKSVWGFYAKAWILSKYGSDDEVMRLIEATVPLWVTQEHLSRVAGGLFPRFVRSPLRSKFEAVIRRAGNPWSMSVLQFHLELTSGTKGYTAIKNFVLAKNTSLPSGISHAKFLMLLSLLSNSDIAPTAVANLKKVHARAITDDYYSLLIP